MALRRRASRTRASGLRSSARSRTEPALEHAAAASSGRSLLVVYFYFTLASLSLICGSVLYYVLVPGAAADRFDAPDALPKDVGLWRLDMDSPEAAAAQKRGLVREVRDFYEEGGGWFGGGRLLRQVRYRSLATDTIEGVEPDRVRKVRRRRYW